MCKETKYVREFIRYPNGGQFLGEAVIYGREITIEKDTLCSVCKRCAHPTEADLCNYNDNDFELNRFGYTRIKLSEGIECEKGGIPDGSKCGTDDETIIEYFGTDG